MIHILCVIVSDAVLVESGGPAFAGEVLSFLVRVLNFGHCYSDESDDNTRGGHNRTTLVKCREWHLDPYLSDDDLRLLMRCLPPARRLEGGPTGAKRPTDTDRMNIHGQFDEQHKFFDRWCLKKQLIEHDVVHWKLNEAEHEDETAPSDGAACQILRHVAGVDISFLKGSNEHACATIIVMTYPALTVVYEAFTYVSLPAPYIAGFLAFREVPALTKLFEDLRRRCPDGNGILHPQGFGLASHFGVLMNTPTIGVGKTFLHVDGLTKPDVKGMMARAKAEHRDSVKFQGESGKVLPYAVWGAALCGTAGATNPVYVSIGHMLSLDSCVAIAQSCSKYRVPEPIRQADLRSREEIRRWEMAGAVDMTLDSYQLFLP
ncbi:hypothetical protein BBJ28_00021042 [Nothophytophthora sp. Chile5]|nr:hypothetical protein BBJ28_00021042 [Nothophytophthora sp. Chile5]